MENDAQSRQPEFHMALRYRVEPDPDRQHMVNLYDMTHYVNYLHKVRLPLELSGGVSPEAKIQQMQAQNSLLGCQHHLPSDWLRRLDKFQDPVAIFPLFVELGRNLRALSSAVLPEFDLLKPSLFLEHQQAFISNAAARLQSLIDNRSRAFIYWDDNDPASMSAVRLLFTPVSFNLPAGVQVSYQKGGNVYLDGRALTLPDSVLAEQWETALELLSFVLYRSLEDIVEKRAPYFLGYIPPNKAIGHATSSGFYDLSLLAGGLSHGTVSHIIQLARLKQMGLNKKDLKSIDSHCWNSALELLIVTSNWPLSFGIRTVDDYNNEVKQSVVFYGLPLMSAPSTMQHLLTNKLLSRLIRAVDRDSSEEEKNYFQENWLRTQGSLAELADNVEALENTVLAEQLASWRMILKHTSQIELPAELHGGEQYFDEKLVPQTAKDEVVARYRARGYTIEEVGNSYIFHPPAFDESWEAHWQHLH